MSNERSRFSIGAILLFATAVLSIGALSMRAAAAEDLSPVEQLYAELAKLPAAERQQRLEEGARREGALTTDSTFRGALGREQYALFHKRYPWLKVDFDNEHSQAEAAEIFVAEEAAGRHLTDTRSFTLTDTGPMLSRHLLAHYPTPATSRILPQYKAFIDPAVGDMWTPWLWSEHGIAYNDKLLKSDEAPKSWDDLCNPRYKGQISFEPAETNFIVGLFLMMGEDHYRDWMRCIGENRPIIAKGHTERLMLMLAGDHEILADTFLYLGEGLRRKNPDAAPFHIVYSAPILATANGMVINRNAPHPYAAALYVDWLLSDENQDFIVKNLRGALTRPHAFIPMDSNLFIYGSVPDEVVKKAHAYWKQYITDKM